MSIMPFIVWKLRVSVFEITFSANTRKQTHTNIERVSGIYAFCTACVENVYTCIMPFLNLILW